MNRLEFFDRIPAMTQAKRLRIQWAYDLAKKWHDGQVRDTGERYFEHVRGVALILIEYGYAIADYLILAILHDILEDTTMPMSMLERLFGARITREILTVSKQYGIEDPLTGFVTQSHKRTKEEYFAGIARSGKRAAVAKCADRIHNLSDLTDPPADSRWAPAKRLDKVTETREWIIPLAQMYEPHMAERLIHLCDLVEIRAKQAQTDAP